jgi:hypothetical protein
MSIIRNISISNIIVVVLVILLICIGISSAQNQIEESQSIVVHSFYDTRLEILCIVNNAGGMQCILAKHLTTAAKTYINTLVKHEMQTAKNKLVPGIIKIPKPYLP